MQHIKKASVLVYTLILVMISVFMALAILSIASILESNIQLQNIVRALASNVISKGNLSIKYGQILNSNGTGFVDTIGCPGSVTMSGTTVRTVSSTTLRHPSDISYCEGIHNATPFYIYFNTGATDFSFAEYAGDTVNLVGKVGSSPFGDGDATLINFSGYVNAPDGIDDEFDSDNYLGTSTGSTPYPDNYQDDDADSRRTLFGYASSDVGFVNMLWDNTKTEKMISDNTNNAGSLNYRLGEVTNGKLYIDINKDFRLRLYRLDKTLFETTGELTFLDKYESIDIAGGVGYLDESSGVLSLSPTPTANTYSFDFQNEDYALFVRNNSTGALLYTLKAEGATGSGVYINPIRDDEGNTVRVLSNDIIIDNTGRFIYEQFEVIGFK